MRLAAPALVDRMSIDYLMWNAYVDGRLCALADPVRAPRRELDEVAALSERFAALLERTVDLVLADPALLASYGFAPALAGLPRPDRHVVLARYDAFRTPDGWRFCEFNADVPGGIHEGAALADLVLGDPSSFRVVPLLTDVLCRDSARPVTAVCYASGYGEDLEQCQFLRRAWSRQGLEAILCSPRNFTFDGRRLSVFGVPVDVVYRFFPGEWLADVENAGALLDALRAGAVRMINPLTSLIAQSKRTMALWHERPDLLTADERELVGRFLPRTETFRLAEMERYRRDRARLVVKRVFGRVGEEVLMGSACDDAEWADWLAWPASEPDQWITQERFDILPEDVGGARLQACYGPYVVDGRFAGFYTRLAADGFIGFNALIGATGPA
ncbi:MAG TPA: glutathionylspermidine synthase family protein [Planctomycetota bacterium]